MEYPVIVERRNGAYRALIPALGELSAEAPSPDEAVQKVRHAAEAYLATVELRTIKLETPQVRFYSTAQDWLAAVKVFEGDEDALREHFAEIESERKRQRDETDGQDAE
jgi:predicted RNase H-like HicB family nuclease